jgi:hypothetical protein
MFLLLLKSLWGIMDQNKKGEEHAKINSKINFDICLKFKTLILKKFVNHSL